MIAPPPGGCQRDERGFPQRGRRGVAGALTPGEDAVYTDRLSTRNAGGWSARPGGRDAGGGAEEPGAGRRVVRPGAAEAAPLTAAGGGRTPGPPRGERFPRRARLRSGAEIRAAFREGERRRSGPLELFWRPGPAGRPRIAFVVPRHGRSIVERNRLKRRLREIARREWLADALDEEVAVDVVVRARARAYEADFEELRTLLTEGLEAVRCDASSSA